MTRIGLRDREREYGVSTATTMHVVTTLRGPDYDAFIALCNIDRRSAAAQLRNLVLRALEERQEEINERLNEEFPEPR